MKEKLCEVMYNMFLDGTLPDLDMEDFEVMWKALMDKWGIKIEGYNWETFLEEINSMSSNKYDWFKQTFNKWFYED